MTQGIKEGKKGKVGRKRGEGREVMGRGGEGEEREGRVVVYHINWHK